MGYETVRLGLADPGRSVDEREPAFVGRSHLPPVRPADESSLGAAASVAAETPHPVTRRRWLLSTHATSRGVGHLSFCVRAFCADGGAGHDRGDHFGRRAR